MAGILVTATGNVGPTTGGQLGTTTLKGGSAASTATIRENGSGGTIIRELAAVIGSSDAHQPVAHDGDHYNGQLHVTLAGTGASLNIELV